MSRLSTFNNPLMLGFDHFERILDQCAKTSAEGYPPYNIEQVSEHALRITLAVAGFTMEDLSVSVEDAQLIIRGRHLGPNGDEGGDGRPGHDEERVYLHRGIAARQFQRAFVLAEGIEVKGSYLDHGLLHVDLERQVIEPEVRTIKIKSGNGNGAKPTETIDVETN